MSKQTKNTRNPLYDWKGLPIKLLGGNKIADVPDGFEARAFQFQDHVKILAVHKGAQRPPMILVHGKWEVLKFEKATVNSRANN